MCVKFGLSKTKNGNNIYIPKYLLIRLYFPHTMGIAFTENSDIEKYRK